MRTSILVLVVFVLGMAPGVAKYNGRPPEAPPAPVHHHVAKLAAAHIPARL